MKLGVLLLWIVDCLQVMFLVWAVYHYMVINYFFPAAQFLLHWQVPLTWFMSNVGSFIAESYFVPQIYSLSKRNKWLTGIIASATLGQFVSAMMVFVYLIQRLNLNIATVSEESKRLIISQQVFAIIANNSIAGASIIYNYYQNEGLFGDAAWMDGWLKILLDYGVLGGVMQVVYLCVYIKHSDTYLWLPYQVASGKLLVNALLARLNNRDITEEKDEMGFNLGHLGVRQVIVPMNDQVRVVTKTIIEADSNSILSSKADTEGQHRSDKELSNTHQN